MKYMTKDWYNDSQKASYHLDLKKSKQAETFSEEFYQQIYEDFLFEMMEFYEELLDMPFKEFCEDYFEDVESPTEEDIEKAHIEYDDFLARFELKKMRKELDESHESNIANYKENIPQEILDKVADIRVFALDFASPIVKKEITAFSKKKEKETNKVIKEYYKYFKKLLKENKNTFIDDFDFHDCVITSCLEQDNNLTLSLDNFGGFTDITGIVFKNYTIIKQDSSLKDAWWLYEEIYKTNDGYELHILLTKEGELLDFIVKVSDTEYIT